ncbi:MAG: hypothetical protein M1834_002676 [Cirrosporium novae-zelandiae]|nr:MAG: hypothetical protein M1834_002676 [Cirrosporium novae-zelandiae]
MELPAMVTPSNSAPNYSDTSTLIPAPVNYEPPPYRYKYQKQRNKIRKDSTSLAFYDFWILAISTCLGKYNPFSHLADPSRDTIWLFDSIAFQDISGAWKAEVTAAYFYKDSGQEVTNTAADIALDIGLHDFGDEQSREETRNTMTERLQLFLDIIAPSTTVNIDFPNGSQQLQPAGSNGISCQVLSVPRRPPVIDTPTIKFEVMDFPPSVSMDVYYNDPWGWTVVSDIDDSIKVTETPSTLGVLKTTFALPFTPVPGMPQLYNHIQQVFSPSWLYLSASPYNLYPVLRPFIFQFYPKGQIILRDNNWMALDDLYTTLTEGTQEFKEKRLYKIHSWIPGRNIICIGDSTQSDPETYAAVYRKHPTWIKGIFIRRVNGFWDNPEERQKKNSTDRFQEAFKDIPRELWKVFDEPTELYADMVRLKASVVI